MRTSRAKGVGSVFIFAAIALYGCWILWAATRTEVPLHVPISMAVGHVRSHEFKVNVSEPYRIEIEVEKKIPFDTLNCLLGTSMALRSTDLQDCPNQPSVVKVRWALTSAGQVVASGSSDDYRSGAWANDTISRELGRFQGQSGRRYILDVDVLQNGTALGPGNPRLAVEVDPMYIEGMAVWGGILFLGSGLLVLIGVIVLVIAYRRDRRARSPVINPS